jgi:hypothetical protein
VDETGAPVPTAEISIARADGSYARSVVANEQGVFRLGFFPPGLYDVEVRALGYRPTQVAGVRVTATETTSLRVEVERTPFEVEELSVVTARPVIDRETTEFTTNLDDASIDRLPVSRTATDLLDFVPGSRSDQLFGGSTSQANSYQLDGVSVNQPGFGGDFLLPNVDWIEEVIVKGLGAGAEYGNFQGGLFNIVTKSGSNTYQGALRFNFESGDLNATNLNTFEAGDEQDQRWELNAEFRGPIAKDKLYFFASGQYSESDFRVVDLGESTPTDVQFLDLLEERRETKLLGKLTWEATDKDIFNILIGKDDVYTDNRGLNSFDDPDTATDQESPSTFFNASWQRTFSPNHLLEVKVNGYTARDDRLPKFGDLSQVQVLGGDRNAFRNATFRRDREPKNLAFKVNLDSYINTGSIQHHFKFGGDLELGSWLEQRVRTGNISWRPELDNGLDTFDPEDPATWGFISSDWNGSINLDANTLNAALYVQDYIRVTDNLSVNPGLRLGIWNGRIDPGDGESFTALEDVKLAPRIGAVWDVTGEAEWVLKGHWGRYYQSLFALMFDRVEGGNVFERTEFWDWIGDGLPDINRPYEESEKEQLFEFFGRSSAFQTGPVEDYSQPYVDQFVVGLERGFGDNWKAELVYVNRRNFDILALIDRNLDSNYTEFNNISVIDFRSGDPVLGPDQQPLVLERLMVSNDDLLFVGEAPGLTPEQIAGLSFDQDLALTNVDEAERKFDQIQVIVSRSARAWSAQASVVWTDLRGNFFAVSGYDDPFGIGSGSFVRPNEQTNFFGKLENFSDWEGKLQLNGNLPLDFRGGAFLTIRSGDHFTPVYRIDRRNHDFETATGELLDPDLIFGIDGEAVFLEERGSREYDALGLLDLRVDKVFEVGNVDLLVGLEVFNVFNSGAVTLAKTEVNGQDLGDATSLFGATRLRVAPRALRLWTSFGF